MPPLDRIELARRGVPTEDLFYNSATCSLSQPPDIHVGTLGRPSYATIPSLGDIAIPAARYLDCLLAVYFQGTPVPHGGDHMSHELLFNEKMPHELLFTENAVPYGFTGIFCSDLIK